MGARPSSTPNPHLKEPKATLTVAPLQDFWRSHAPPPPNAS